MANKREPDKLAIEAAMATAAGMSYGKWKALHPGEFEKRIDPKIKQCAHCGKEFVGKRNKKYCCMYCAERDWKERGRRKIAEGL